MRCAVNVKSGAIGISPDVLHHALGRPVASMPRYPSGYGDGLEIIANKATVGVIPARVQILPSAPSSTFSG